MTESRAMFISRVNVCPRNSQMNAQFFPTSYNHALYDPRVNPRTFHHPLRVIYFFLSFASGSRIETGGCVRRDISAFA